MTYKVSLANSNPRSVRLVSSLSFDIEKLGGGSGDVAGNLTDLNDVDQSGIGNRFVLVYDSVTTKFKFVNPDEVVNAAAGSATVPGGAPTPDGFSQETIDELDEALDNKIDLDAGQF